MTSHKADAQRVNGYEVSWGDIYVKVSTKLRFYGISGDRVRRQARAQQVPRHGPLTRPRGRTAGKHEGRPVHHEDAQEDEQGAALVPREQGRRRQELLAPCRFRSLSSTPTRTKRCRRTRCMTSVIDGTRTATAKVRPALRQHQRGRDADRSGDLSPTTRRGSGGMDPRSRSCAPARGARAPREQNWSQAPKGDAAEIAPRTRDCGRATHRQAVEEHGAIGERIAVVHTPSGVVIVRRPQLGDLASSVFDNLKGRDIHRLAGLPRVPEQGGV